MLIVSWKWCTHMRPAYRLTKRLTRLASQGIGYFVKTYLSNKLSNSHCVAGYYNMAGNMGGVYMHIE